MKEVERNGDVLTFCRFCNKTQLFFRLKRAETNRTGRKLILYKCYSCNAEIGIEERKEDAT